MHLSVNFFLCLFEFGRFTLTFEHLIKKLSALKKTKNKAFSLFCFCCLKVTFSTHQQHCNLRAPFDTVVVYLKSPEHVSMPTRALSTQTTVEFLLSISKTEDSWLENKFFTTLRPLHRWPNGPNPRTTTEDILFASPNLRLQSHSFAAPAGSFHGNGEELGLAGFWGGEASLQMRARK